MKLPTRSALVWGEAWWILLLVTMQTDTIKYESHWCRPTWTYNFLSALFDHPLTLNDSSMVTTTISNLIIPSLTEFLWFGWDFNLQVTIVNTKRVVIAVVICSVWSIRTRLFTRVLPLQYGQAEMWAKQENDKWLSSSLRCVRMQGVLNGKKSSMT